MKIVSSAEMRWLEAEAMQREQDGEIGGRSGFDMMLAAGQAAASEAISFAELLSDCGYAVKRVVVLAGKGNNGGDAWVVADSISRFARSNNAKFLVELYSVCQLDELKGDALRHAQKCSDDVIRHLGVASLPEDFGDDNVLVIDGLLGTGVSGNVRGTIRDWIAQVNKLNVPVLALDVPSGLDADSGTGDCVIEADLTVTMGLPKTGLFRNEGPRTCGRLVVGSIGLSHEMLALPQSSLEGFGIDEARKMVRRRPGDGHKGVFGHLLCVCGSSQYGGAAELSCIGGMRSGAGLVTLAVPESSPARSPLSSVIFSRFPDARIAEFLPSLLSGKQALVFGCGIGSGVDPLALDLLFGSGLPMVLDADGLRLLASNPEVLPMDLTLPCVLTPHPGEFRALQSGFGLVSSGDRVADAIAMSHWTGCVVLLKGRFSVVAAPDEDVATVNLSGGSSLSTAGTGDVLAGLVGGLLAQGMPAKNAARLGAFIHGLAGDLWACAPRTMTADDLNELLPKAFSKVNPMA